MKDSLAFKLRRKMKINHDHILWSSARVRTSRDAAGTLRSSRGGNVDLCAEECRSSSERKENSKQRKQDIGGTETETRAHLLT